VRQQQLPPNHDSVLVLTSEGVYNLRPYNINLNPVCESRLGIERVFSVQSTGMWISCNDTLKLSLSCTAMEFLFSHGFSLDRVFNFGVPYLSRDEQVYARQQEDAKADMSNSIPDIQLRSDDTHSLKFVDRVREDITVWSLDAKVRKLILALAAHAKFH